MRFTHLLLIFTLAACSSAPPVNEPSRAERAASQAAGMVGKPYRAGGTTPAGFDCSGLVFYSYRKAGVALPRDTVEQRRVSQRVQYAELRRGDLLFFNEQGRRNSHVAIYLGGGRFVHAPSSGKPVRQDRLDNPYWKKLLSETRRVAA